MWLSFLASPQQDFTFSLLQIKTKYKHKDMENGEDITVDENVQKFLRDRKQMEDC